MRTPFAFVLLLALALPARAQDTYDFASGALPDLFECLGACTVAPADSGHAVRLGRGGALVYRTTNLAWVGFGYRLAGAGPAAALHVDVSPDGAQWSSIDGGGPLQAVAGAMRPHGVRTALVDNVFVRWSLPDAPTGAVLLDDVQVGRLPADQVLNLKLSARFSEFENELVRKAAAETSSQSRNATLAAVDAVEARYWDFLSAVVQMTGRSGNVFFEATLAESIGGLNASVNPLNYGEFRRTVDEVETLSGPVARLHLEDIRRQLREPRSKFDAFVKGVAGTVSGVLENTAFGILANGLKAVVASTYSAYNLEARTPPTAACVAEALTGSRIKTSEFRRVVTGCLPQADPAFAGALGRGEDTYARISEFLDIMTAQNSRVNGFNDLLLQVANQAQADEAKHLTRLRHLLTTVGMPAEDTRTVAYELYNRDAGAEARVRAAVAAHFDALRAEIPDGASETQLRAVSERLAAMRERFSQINERDRVNYNALVDQYEAFFFQVLAYVGGPNPFTDSRFYGRGDAACPAAMPADASALSAFCRWDVTSRTLREKLERLHRPGADTRTRFEERFPKIAPIG